MTDQKILVTGAAGFIGFHVVQRLASAGREVVGLDIVNDYYDPTLKEARLRVLEKLPSFRFVRMDLADRMQAEIARLGFLEMSDSGGLLSRTTTDVFQGARFMRTMARYAAHEFPWEEALPGRSPFFPGRRER